MYAFQICWLFLSLTYACAQFTNSATMLDKMVMQVLSGIPINQVTKSAGPKQDELVNILNKWVGQLESGKSTIIKSSPMDNLPNNIHNTPTNMYGGHTPVGQTNLHGITSLSQINSDLASDLAGSMPDLPNSGVANPAPQIVAQGGAPNMNQYHGDVAQMNGQMLPANLASLLSLHLPNNNNVPVSQNGVPSHRFQDLTQTNLEPVMQTQSFGKPAQNQNQNPHNMMRTSNAPNSCPIQRKMTQQQNIPVHSGSPSQLPQIFIPNLQMPGTFPQNLVVRHQHNLQAYNTPDNPSTQSRPEQHVMPESSHLKPIESDSPARPVPPADNLATFDLTSFLRSLQNNLQPKIDLPEVVHDEANNNHSPTAQNNPQNNNFRFIGQLPHSQDMAKLNINPEGRSLATQGLGFEIDPLFLQQLQHSQQ